MTTHYTRTAKGLHWLMAILFFGLLALGFYMHDLPLSPEKLQALFLAQVGRGHGLPARLVPPVLARRAPAAGAAGKPCPTLMQRAAHAGHFLLYALMIAIPLSGLADELGQGFPDGLVRRPADPRPARQEQGNSATCCKAST